ncbi:MAG: 4Fe-4S binding protein [Desulfobacterota bacterium]|nr:4Fe-4S binding protein [Thermodesulfobacteriota bacterium]MDW8002521.1 4Fe-4S binding protein [Deltaproteobacteria bacterium]
MKVDTQKCIGCGLCEEVCPLEVIQVHEKKAKIAEGCCECKTCLKVCPEDALRPDEKYEGEKCTACPVMCVIPEGYFGACKRYVNEKGKVVRKGRIHTYEEVKDIIKGEEDALIEEPLILGIGSGTTYPDFRPSPFIVSGIREGTEIVTVVTEAPLSYSGLKLKIDTDLYIGEETKSVYVLKKGRRKIGHVCTEEYGSKMISLGGVNILTSKDGLFAAKTIYEILLGRWVKLYVEDGATVEISLGKTPVVDGKKEEVMRVGCGSATTGLFAPTMMEAADEIIILDGHITGLFSEHPSGRYLGKKRSPIYIKGKKSTDGRYFLNKGRGIGGTDIERPLDVIEYVDWEKAKEGLTLLITETTGTFYAYFRLKGKEFVEEPPPKEALRFIELLRSSCEKSKVSALFSAGIGGSARAGVTKNPLRLTRAVHEGKVRITIGGARPFVFPGGGINFLVDVEKIKYGSIYLSPTPSFILPIEYTMRRETFEEIGGHIEALRPVEEVLNMGK